MSSVKPEVGLHNLSQRRQRRTEPRQQATWTKNFNEVRPRGFRVMRADRHTDKQTYSSQHFGTLRVEWWCCTILHLHYSFVPCASGHCFPYDIAFFSTFISYTGGQSVSHVLLWQPSECDSMLFSENKYDDDDDDDVCTLCRCNGLPSHGVTRPQPSLCDVIMMPAPASSWWQVHYLTSTVSWTTARTSCVTRVTSCHLRTISIPCITDLRSFRSYFICMVDFYRPF